jgi:hypothetical protein
MNYQCRYCRATLEGRTDELNYRVKVRIASRAGMVSGMNS